MTCPDTETAIKGIREELRRVLASDPTVALRFWYALRACWDYPEDAPPGGAADPRKQLQDALEVVEAAGCPEEVTRALFGAARRDEPETVVLARLSLLKEHVDPPEWGCLEAVANLDPDEPTHVLWLTGRHLVSTTGAIHRTQVQSGAEERVRPGDYQTLSRSAGITRCIARMVASNVKEIALPQEDVERFRELAALRGERWSTVDAGPVQLIELHAADEYDDPDLCHPRDCIPYIASWLHGTEVPTPGYERNWVVARAAGLLMDICRGISTDRVKLCADCGRLFVDPRRRAQPAKYCHPCRPQKHRHRSRTVELHEEDGEYYVLLDMEKLTLDAPDGVDLGRFDTVDVLPSRDVSTPAPESAKLDILQSTPR